MFVVFRFCSFLFTSWGLVRYLWKWTCQYLFLFTEAIYVPIVPEVREFHSPTHHQTGNLLLMACQQQVLDWLYLTLRSRSRGTPSKGVDSPKGSFQDSTVSGSFSSTDSSSTDPNNTISQIRKNEALNESIIVKNVLYSTQENVLAIHEVFRQVSLGIAIFCLLLILLLTNFKCK